MDKLILGIDLGKKTGLCLCNMDNGNDNHPFIECALTIDSNDYDKLKQLIYKADYIAIEQPFARKNLRAFQMLAEQLGIIKYLCSELSREWHMTNIGLANKYLREENLIKDDKTTWEMFFSSTHEVSAYGAAVVLHRKLINEFLRVVENEERL